MTAAAPFDWISTTVSAGTLVLGGILTMAGSALADLRASKRETRARRDQLQIQLSERDREILYALQEVTLEIHNFHIDLVEALSHRGGPTRTGMLGRDYFRPVDQLFSRQTLWLYRCRSEVVRNAITAHVRACRVVHESQDASTREANLEIAMGAFRDAQWAMGEELRRSSVGDLGIAPWRLRRREEKRLKARRRLDTGPVDNS
ncbi:hypothetical protein ACFSKW_54595 [Nonomuraea mangrovi]|uniref:Uncharacterized protein n=1 Tax=Nonomuraea mangrovi TaxID=2316207 RepID=A0ABW4TER8_9ACTN